MSDISQGDGWWRASDGKWYPPTLQSGQTYGVTSEQPPSNITVSATTRQVSSYVAAGVAALVALALACVAIIGPITSTAVNALTGPSESRSTVATVAGPPTTTRPPRTTTTAPDPADLIDDASRKSFREVPNDFWEDGAGTVSVSGINAEFANPDLSKQLLTATIATLMMLDFDDAVYAKMDTTSALDGRQSDTSDCCEVSWTYHPKNGLSVVIEPR